jgi:hypothetical protein
MNPAALAKVAMAVRPKRKATAAEQMKSTLMKAGGQVALGVVKTGGGIVKGMSGLTSMAAKKINNALDPNPQDSEFFQKAKRLASAAKPMLNSVAKRADKEYAAAEKTLAQVEPQLDSIGKTAAYASSLIPGPRALEIPMAIGAAKNVSGGVVPAVAAFATRKIPVPLVRNAAQEAINTAATPPPQATLPRKPLPEKNA